MTFEQTFRSFIPILKSISYSFSTTTKVPYEDYFSELQQCLWECFKEFKEEKETSFRTYATNCLKRRAIDVSRSKYAKYYITIDYSVEVSDENESLISNQVSYRQKKKKADKQKLIDSLLESSKILTDPKMTAIIRGLPGYKSITDAATSNGLDYNQIARPLKRMARHYNPEIHGDILDYFPDDVEVKREFLTA